MTDGRGSVRVYRSLRTAHLERLAHLPAARTLYRRTRYDYDEGVLTGTAAAPPERLSRWGILRTLASTPFTTVEVNEPLMWRAWPDIALMALVLRVRDRLTGRRTRLVAYCIGHVDPATEIATRRRLPPAVTGSITRLILSRLLRVFDRLAAGTEGTAEILRGYTRKGAPDVTVVPALPQRCACTRGESSLAPRAGVLFLGAFDDRKGIRQLMAAWDEIEAGAATGDRPSRQTVAAGLTLVGTGSLLPLVRVWSATRPSTTLVVDPPRHEVHAALRRAVVVVLPSQRVGTWREQVGLPIVEGLAHGCHVVTTDETGLARWLEGAGHHVVPATADSPELAAGIVSATTGSMTAGAVWSQLPHEDGRLEADRWLHAADLGRFVFAWSQGRGPESWQDRGRTGGVPGAWPYGLDGLSRHRLVGQLDAVELRTPGRVQRAAGRLTASLPRRKPTSGFDVALAWDENVAIRMVQDVKARHMVSGVVWATDRTSSPGAGRQRAALRRLDGVWCLSRAQIEPLRRWLGPDGPSVHHVPFGVDHDFYALRPYPARPLVASVGGDRDRDVPTMLQAMARVRLARPDVRCVLVGRAARGLPVPAGVEVLDSLPHHEVRELLAQASVVAVATRPNLHVSGMTVALEAMAVGRPVVLTGTPGADDYVVGGTGHLVPPHDAGAMARTLLDVLSDPSRAAETGLAARRHVETSHTTGTLCEALIEVVQEIVVREGTV